MYNYISVARFYIHCIYYREYNDYHEKEEDKWSVIRKLHLMLMEHTSTSRLHYSIIGVSKFYKTSQQPNIVNISFKWPNKNPTSNIAFRTECHHIFESNKYPSNSIQVLIQSFMIKAQQFSFIFRGHSSRLKTIIATIAYIKTHDL